MTPRAFVAALVALVALAVAPAWGQPESMVAASIKAQRLQVIPGDQLAIAAILDHQEGWHSHPSEPVLTAGMKLIGFVPIPTTLTMAESPSVKAWAVQWPEIHQVNIKLTGKPEQYGVYEGKAIAYLPIQVSASAAVGSTIQLAVSVSYQACDETSCVAEETVSETITLTVVDPAGRAAAPTDPDFAKFDSTVFATTAAAVKTIKFNAFGWTFEIDPSGAGFILLLAVAALGGLLLNFTPCVLPVIPLKIMGLSQAAKTPGRCLFLGTMMSLGTVAFWVAIGGAIAFISGFTAISSLFQTSWFALLVGAFILVMALGMLGAFVVRLPQSVYMVNPSHDTAVGSFGFGIMTAVLSTPCTAPFMGSAAAWAATQNPVITLATFGAIGFGMAVPYFILSAFPRLLSRMPRTGPASELIKQVMGMLMVAVAVFFLGTGIDPLLRAPVDDPIRFYWWIIAAIAVGAMVWLVVRTFAITRRPAPRLFWGAFALLFAATTVIVARSVTDRGPIPWIGYTPERLAQAMKEGKTVVVDFTAEWCINCKALEKTVLHQPDVVALLTKDPGVIPMKVDLTGNNEPGRAKLKELGWLGIPLLAVYGPGSSEPHFRSDAYTPAMVIEAINRGRGVAVGGPIPWIEFTPERFARAVSDGKSVVVNFTAEWDISTKALERAVFDQPEMIEALAGDASVVPMVADMTRADAPGKHHLKDLGRLGVPAIAVYGPGTPEPFVSDACTPAMVIEAINKSRPAAAVPAAPTTASR